MNNKQQQPSNNNNKRKRLPKCTLKNSCCLILLIPISWFFYKITHTRLTPNPPCQIVEYGEWNNMTPEDFNVKFQIPRIPAVFRKVATNQHGWDLSQWTLSALKHKFPETLFRYGGSPYPTRELKLHDMRFDEASTPHLFQFGMVPATFTVGHKPCLPIKGLPHPYAKLIHDNLTIACEILENIVIPPFLSANNAAIIHLAGLFISGSGSFIPMHKHHAAVNILIHGGKKQWDMDEACFINQDPGDVVFIPEDMNHRVWTLDFSIAVQLQWHANHFLKNIGIGELDRMIEFGKQQQHQQQYPAVG
jgi:hypothetical protein